MAVPVAVALAGEVLLIQRHARERGVPLIDPGVEHGHSDAGSVEARRIGADGRQAPRVADGGRCRHRLDQDDGHRDGDAGLRVTTEAHHVPIAEVGDFQGGGGGSFRGLEAERVRLERKGIDYLQRSVTMENDVPFHRRGSPALLGARNSSSRAREVHWLDGLGMRFPGHARHRG